MKLNWQEILLGALICAFVCSLAGLIAASYYTCTTIHGTDYKGVIVVCIFGACLLPYIITNIPFLKFRFALLE